MKGTTFLKPLEFSLETVGENWVQGTSVRGSVRVKNHGVESITIDRLFVKLAYADFKGVRSRDPHAFEAVSAIDVATHLELGPNMEVSKEWSFNLDSNCPITDKSGSLYVLYGAADDVLKNGQLQLNVEMRPLLKEYLQVWDLFFRFRINGIKMKGDAVEVKLMSPKSRETANIDNVMVLLRMNQDNLEIKYTFNVQALEVGTMAHQAQVEKKKKIFEQTLTPKDYLIYGNAPNQEGMKKAIHEIVAQVLPKFLY